LARLGREAIPVAAGRSTPLAGDKTFPEPWRERVNDLVGLELPQSESTIQPLPASELLVQVLNASPEPLTLFVAGTHTNLAGALRLDPGIVTKIASMHVMGGALYVPGNIAPGYPEIQNRVAEWNIFVDPLAAAEVFGADLPIHLTPLDATNQVVWTQEDAAQWAASGTPEGQVAAEIFLSQLHYLRDIFPKGMFFWDLVTAVQTTHPALFRQEEVHIEVVTRPDEEEGRTRVVPDRPPNATACLSPRAAELKRVATQILGLPRQIE
jgi:pyrimidine-specific ribonucleoside hydrolase